MLPSLLQALADVSNFTAGGGKEQLL